MHRTRPVATDINHHRSRRSGTMYRTRSFAIAATLAATLVAIPAAASAQGDTPVTLRFAVSDSQDELSAPYVTAFVDEVARQSNGSVTLTPIWEAGGGLPQPGTGDLIPDAFGQGYEQTVAHMLVDGEADLALAASRAWDAVGITSLEALQAPFLIDNDALILAVATSPIADALLTSMSTVGVTGLAMWPEDLRHPVAFDACIPPITNVEQLRGLTIRAIPSGVTWDLLRTLGATPIGVNSFESLVATCRVDAAEFGPPAGLDPSRGRPPSRATSRSSPSSRSSRRTAPRCPGCQTLSAPPSSRPRSPYVTRWSRSIRPRPRRPPTGVLAADAWCWPARRASPPFSRLRSPSSTGSRPIRSRHRPSRPSGPSSPLSRRHRARRRAPRRPSRQPRPRRDRPRH